MGCKYTIKIVLYPEDIDDTRIVEVCKKQNKELLDALYESSIEYFEEDLYREDCLIDSYGDEYDLDKEEGQFSKTKKEWWH